MSSSTLYKRVLSATTMIIGFISVLYSAALLKSNFRLLPIISLIIALQIMSYEELLILRDRTQLKSPYPRLIDYGFLISIQLSFFGTYLYFIDYPIYQYKLYSGLIFIVNVLYLITKLKLNILKIQFYKFSWSISAIFVIIISNFHIINLYRGLLWFVLPVFLVTINDIGAYLTGKIFCNFFIPTKWSELSPNKTWEGFIGASIITILSGLIFSYICPLSQNFITYYPNLLEYQEYKFLGLWYIHLNQLQIDTFILSCLASFICPFIGLLASALKRAYKIKDFGNLIPGHGGIIDRLDCISIIGILTYIYLDTFH